MSQSTVDFSYLQSTLTLDQEIREQIRESTKLIDTHQRPLIALLSRVHSTPASNLPSLLQSLNPLLPPLKESLNNLATLIPQEQFYRYSDSFSRSIQQSSFIIVLSAFLKSGDVPTKEEVESELGGGEWKGRMWLSTEDYLHSLISLVNELSRLAINRVTMGDYSAPVQYSQFAKELSNAFGLLNLKNDSLRKRFDSIKYDVKKLEEVVYDLSLRGLLNSTTTDAKVELDGSAATATSDQNLIKTEETTVERENKRARMA